MNEQSEWHFIVDDAGERRQAGPVSTDDLADLASSGEISADTLVWREGMDAWAPAGEVAEFSGYFHQEAPPQTEEAASTAPPDAGAPEETVAAAEPPEIVTLKDFGNHSVRFDAARKTLLVVTNDYHAGPLELTKLDLLGFLTAMEKADDQSR